MNLLVYFVNSFIISFVFFYASSKVFNQKLDWKSSKVIKTIIFQAILLTIFYLITFSYIRLTINFIILFSLNKYIFKNSLFKTILGTFFVFVVLILSEIIHTIVIMLIFKMDIKQFQEHYSAQLISNLLISLIMYLIISSKKILSLFRSIIKNLHVKNNKTNILLIIFIVLILTILLYYIYFELPPVLSILMTMLLIVGFTILTIIVFKEKNENNQLQIESEVLINNLNEYENMLDTHRILNHENKNQLIAIKGLVKEKNQEAENYIDSILKVKTTDDDELLLKTNKIPSGGLRGLIYQKILAIQENKINYNLEISKNVDKDLFKKLTIETNQHTCTIIGTYLDNAIEAVVNLNKKDIGINMYVENQKFIITISNNFEGIVDLSKFEQKGYSTKGKNRGYGLSLVRKIINDDPNIESNTEVIGDRFKQILKIKM